MIRFGIRTAVTIKSRVLLVAHRIIGRILIVIAGRVGTIRHDPRVAERLLPGQLCQRELVRALQRGSGGVEHKEPGRGEEQDPGGKPPALRVAEGHSAALLPAEDRPARQRPQDRRRTQMNP